LQRAAPLASPDNRVHRIERRIEDSRAGLGSLRYSPAQNTSSAYAKTVSHNKKGASIHSLKQGNIFFRESLGREDVEDCSVIYSIKGILDIQVQEDRQTGLSSALLRQYAVQLTKLSLSTSTSTESFLRIVIQHIIFRGAVQSLINYFEEERKLCADARNRPKLWHQ
jgi:hypothetical protein